MKFTFLGNLYEANLFPIFVDLGQVGGKYRGQFWFKKQLKDFLVPQTSHCLKYRGVQYISTVYRRDDRTVVTDQLKPTNQEIDLFKMLEEIDNTDDQKVTC